jgi:hypothetical protein
VPKDQQNQHNDKCAVKKAAFITLPDCGSLPEELADQEVKKAASVPLPVGKSLPVTTVKTGGLPEELRALGNIDSAQSFEI